jgi:hypothetical protein
MPTEPKKPLIVISYAHADEPEHPAEGEVKWLSFVTGYLRPAIKQGAVDLWLDRLMPGGADWEREIEQKLRACDIFILLVSRYSLSSDYIVDREIAIIRERQARGEAVHFYPLVLTPTPKIGLDLVRDKNLRPRDGKPLSDYSISERYRSMSATADQIAELADEIAKRKAPSDYVSLGNANRGRGVILDQTAEEGKPIRIVLGTDAPYESDGRAGSYRRRFVRVKLQNASPESFANCRLDIVNIRPANQGVDRYVLKDDITLAANSDLFVNVAHHDSDPGLRSSGKEIHLDVSTVRDSLPTFTIAHSVAALPAKQHTCELQLLCFSNVYDGVICRIFLDRNGTLRLEETITTVEDTKTLEDWLRRRNIDITVTIAARAALRLTPFARPRYSVEESKLLGLFGAIFRANALARALGKYPNRAPEFRVAGASWGLHRSRRRSRELCG